MWCNTAGVARYTRHSATQAQVTTMGISLTIQTQLEKTARLEQSCMEQERVINVTLAEQLKVQRNPTQARQWSWDKTAECVGKDVVQQEMQ